MQTASRQSPIFTDGGGCRFFYGWGLLALGSQPALKRQPAQPPLTWSEQPEATFADPPSPQQEAPARPLMVRTVWRTTKTSAATTAKATSTASSRFIYPTRLPARYYRPRKLPTSRLPTNRQPIRRATSSRVLPAGWPWPRSRAE
jgi:hypothetical protein